MWPSGDKGGEEVWNVYLKENNNRHNKSIQLNAADSNWNCTWEKDVVCRQSSNKDMRNSFVTPCVATDSHQHEAPRKNNLASFSSFGFFVECSSLCVCLTLQWSSSYEWLYFTKASTRMSPPASRSASECSHFRTCPSFWPYLAIQIQVSFLKQFKSYHDETSTPTHQQTLVKTIPPVLRYRCVAGNIHTQRL